MKFRNHLTLLITVFMLTGIFCGCEAENEKNSSGTVKLVLEEGEGFWAPSYVLETGIGEDVSFSIALEDGYEITSVDAGHGYQESEILTTSNGKDYTLTLKENHYSKSIHLKTRKAGDYIYYNANGGTRIAGDPDAVPENRNQSADAKADAKTDAKDTDAKTDSKTDVEDTLENVPVLASDKHLRRNSSIGTDLFEREGYTLTSWNTKPDGSGKAIGLGSRVDYKEGLTLYAQWAKWEDKENFTTSQIGGGLCITGFKGQKNTLVIPGKIDGKEVWQISEGTLTDGDYEKLILPATIKRVEKNSLAASVQEIWLYDNIQFVSQYAISASSTASAETTAAAESNDETEPNTEDAKNSAGKLKTLHINAILPPVYSGNYFATFADKFDRLLSIKDEKKIVLFSGSSTRFGYDSEAIEKAFPDYQVVNMGVFAYTNAWPQLLLIEDLMKEGDVLIDSPEFDAALRQFCTHHRIEDEFFAMCEADYDLVARLNLQECEDVFSAMTEYLNNRIGMEAKTYGMSPGEYDEDGAKVSLPSYNKYGDYILYRANASTKEPIYGLPVDYTVNSFPKEQFIDPINLTYQRFLDQGVKVFFTYAPRNQLAISKESTREKRDELDAYFHRMLKVPVLSTIEDSLYSGTYLYGTDNHLSTEGVAIRTEKIIEELKPYLEGDL